MKAFVFFALLAFGSCQGSTEGVKSSSALTFEKTRKLSASQSALDLVPLDVVDEEAFSESNLEPVTCAPARNLDFDSFRAGTISVVRYNTTAFECARHCRDCDSDTCLAFNYFRNRTCHELKSIGKVSDAKAVQGMTSVQRFAAGDGCNAANFLYDKFRGGSGYKKVGLSTAVACCRLCASESKRCRAWGYNSDENICYLKDIVPKLGSWGSKGVITIGLGCAGPCTSPTTSP